MLYFCCDILILVKKSFSKYEEIISNYSNFNILYKPFPISNFPEIISKRATKMILYVLEMIISCAKKWFPFGNDFFKWFTATKNDFWLFFAEKKNDLQLWKIIYFRFRND